MRPLKLHLEFFGPYRDTTVDFTKFDTTPLFLISGKTGSGKTTIFDGMCYALFDQTSGTDRQAPAMRSDFATPQDRTRVEFWFAHKNRRYQIVRQPAQTLAKKRGTGVTDVTASVTLTVFEDQTEVKQLTKIGQVRDYLQELLQMDGRQFAQIVLLPQGQFRRFLVADSDTKAQVLEQLFATTVYAQWADQLKTKLRQSHQANQTALDRLQHVQGELQWTAINQEAASDLTARHQTDALLKLMAQQQTTTLTAENAAQEKLAAAQQRVTHLTQQAEQEKQFLADQQRLATAQAAQKALANQADEMTRLQAQVTELDWVQRLQPKWQAAQSAQRAVVQRQADQRRQTQRLSRAQTELADTHAALQRASRLPDLITDLQDQLAQQAAIKPLYQQIEALKAQQKTAQQAQQYAQQREEALGADVQASCQQRDQQRAIVDHQGEWYAQSQALQQTALRNADWQQRLTQLTTTQQTLTTAQATLAALVDKVQQARAAADQAQTAADQRYQQRLRSQIVELSAQLTPGSPCPVCGATTHPHPAAQVATTPVTAAMVKAAQKKATTAQQTVAQLVTQRDQLQRDNGQQQVAWQNDLAALQAAITPELQLPETADLAALTAAVTRASDANRQAVKRVDDQLAAVQTAQKKLDDLQKTIQSQQADLTAAQTATQAAKTQLAQFTAQLAAQQQRLPKDALTLTEFTALEATRKTQLADSQAQLKALQQRATEATQGVAVAQGALKTANTELTKSTALAQTTQQAVDQALADHGITVTSATTQQLTQQFAALAHLATYRQRIQDFQREQAQNQTTLAELRQRLADKPQPNPEKTQAALTTAQAQVSDLQDARYQANARWQRNDELVTQLQQQLAAQKTALQQTQELEELSGVLNGDGPNSKLGLERYVLQTYLRQILRVGNARLQQLTNGRYQFVIDDAPAASKKYSGLEINVYDDHVGEQRSVHTLSGGESFIAALALALALGEVIQQTTGSVDVDALFIDEGFGSLDEDALMTALESLETIEGRHRMIGIISHVSELRAQVPNQLQVVARGNGESQVRYQLHEND